ncbi:MAG: 2-oxo acid dehydrogenase subunit E2 [Aggregatilineales bacterium]
MATKIIMPQLGESIVEGTITRWLKREGEPVAQYEPLLEVDTDKVTTEVPSPVDGRLLKIVVPEGTTVKMGELLAYIGAPDETIEAVEGPAGQETSRPASGEAPASAGLPAPGATPVAARMAAELGVDVTQVPGTGQGGRITKGDVATFASMAVAGMAARKPTPGAGGLEHERDAALGTLISPIVSQLAARYAIDLRQVRGTGSGGRVTKRDVLAYLERAAAAPAAQLAETAPSRPVSASSESGTIIPLSAMRRAIADHMVRSKQTSPHVTTVMEADLTAVETHRHAHKAAFAARGVNLTYTAYFIGAAAAALVAHPHVNSSWDAAGVKLHPAIHIGMATALDEGLIVPVIKYAERKSLFGLAAEINDLAARARGGGLQPDDVAGATFTVTNHGTSGSLFATPIINQPQAAILGVGAIEKRPRVLETETGDVLAIRPMVYLSLTFDHRILDGAGADAFLSAVKRALENWQ